MVSADTGRQGMSVQFLQVSAAVWNPARETGCWEIYLMSWDLDWVAKDKEKPCRWKRYIRLCGWRDTGELKINNRILDIEFEAHLRLLESELQEDKWQLWAGMLVIARSHS